MRTVIAVFKMTAFVGLCLVIVPPQMILLAFYRGPYAYVIPRFFHQGVCFIFRIRVIQSGFPVSQAQTLFISNHLSYLDIPVTGSLLKASFVAKEDVAKWPVFGFLSKLQQTAFISRNRTQATQGKNALENMLAEGKSLILFPEGTSTDGRGIMPFKSSLFSIVAHPNAHNLYIQPFTIRMDQTGGKALETQDDRDLYAWHINMDTSLGSHLWRFALNSGAIISLVFHKPFPAQELSDRKTLAKTCYEAVCSGLNIENRP